MSDRPAQPARLRLLGSEDQAVEAIARLVADAAVRRLQARPPAQKNAAGSAPAARGNGPKA